MSYRKPCGSVVDALGNTPLVRLRRVVENLPVEIYAKLEFLNPMGSSKDRISKYMIEAAERDAVAEIPACPRRRLLSSGATGHGGYECHSSASPLLRSGWACAARASRSRTACQTGSAGNASMRS